MTTDITVTQAAALTYAITHRRLHPGMTNVPLVADKLSEYGPFVAAVTCAAKDGYTPCIDRSGKPVWQHVPCGSLVVGKDSYADIVSVCGLCTTKGPYRPVYVEKE
jgi:hypothetical protein